jgi:hypothetical protein
VSECEVGGQRPSRSRMNEPKRDPSSPRQQYKERSDGLTVSIKPRTPLLLLPPNVASLSERTLYPPPLPIEIGRLQEGLFKCLSVASLFEA